MYVASRSNRKSKVETKRVGTKFWRYASLVCVIYDIVRGYISKKIIGRLDSEPQVLKFPLRLRSRNIQHFGTKTVRHLRSLAPCEVSSITSHCSGNFFRFLIKSINNDADKGCSGRASLGWCKSGYKITKFCVMLFIA